MGPEILASLVEVPEGWENGGGFASSFDGMNLEVDFGEGSDPPVSLKFAWVRSFRFVSEASYDSEHEGWSPDQALLTELSLPDPDNPSDDYYGHDESYGKGPPRLFRLFHYKAGVFEIVALDWCRG